MALLSRFPFATNLPSIANAKRLYSKISLPEELDLTSRADFLKAASSLWETILTKSYDQISLDRDALLTVLDVPNSPVDKLSASDLADVIALFIKYLSYYHALGLSTPSEEFYRVAERLGEHYIRKSTDTGSEQV